MSFSFKIAGKAKAKVAVNIEEKQDRKELITGVHGNEIRAVETQGGPDGPRVIPKLENTYKVGRGKFVPTFVPEAHSITELGKLDDRYEAAVGPTQPLITSYGLEVRGPAAAAAAPGPSSQQQQPAATPPDQPATAAAPATESAAAAPSGSTPPAAPVHPAPAPAADGALPSRGHPQDFKQELEALPEENDLERYEAMPVEDFGMALLRGLGWKDGEGVGRKRQLVEAKQAIRRPERLGLGANPAAPAPTERPRPRKMGDPVAPDTDLVVAPDADGRQRHRAGASDKLVARSSLLPGPRPNKTMRVAGGRHQGLTATVLELLPVQGGRSAYARVRLHPSEEVVEVRCSDLEDRQPGAAAAALARAPSTSNSLQTPPSAAAAAVANGRGSPGRLEDSSSRQPQGGADSRGRSGVGHQDHQGGSRGSKRQGEGRGSEELPPDKRSRGVQEAGRGEGREQGDRGPDDSRHHHHHHHHHRHQDSAKQQQHSSKGAGSKQQQQEPLWAAPLIRVRLLDKKVKGGALYLKKGVVVDVHPGGLCDLRVEGTGQMVSLPQQQLETVVPKEAGGGVLVVAGKHRGRRGRVLHSSSSKGAVAVQLTGDMMVVQLALDDVAQYMGSLDDDE